MTAGSALIYMLLVALSASALLHPTEVYSFATVCPDGYGWADAASYALLAVVVTLSVVAARRLLSSLRNGDGSWVLIGLAYGVVALAVLSSRSTACASINFGFVNEPSATRPLILAVLAVSITLVALNRVSRRRQ